MVPRLIDHHASSFPAVPVPGSSSRTRGRDRHSMQNDLMPLEASPSLDIAQRIPMQAMEATEAELHARRFRHVLRAILLALAVVTIDGAYEADWRAVGLMLCAVPPALLAGWLAQRKQIEWAASVLVCTLTGLLVALAAIGQGLHDEAVLGIPGVFVLSGLFAKRHAFWIVFVAFCGALISIAAANLLGWHVNPVQSLSGVSLLNVLAILGVTAFYIDMMSTDLRRALARLAQENQTIRESKALSDQAARHDVLTGLPNRVLARERLSRAIGRASGEDVITALLFVDLDHFKEINDTLGHAAGDAVLREVARRLLECVRKGDTVSRQGGDEFLLIVSGISDADAAGAVAKKIIATLDLPFVLGETQRQIAASIGIALIPAHGRDFETLLGRADKAMYRAKAAGRRCFRIYEGEHDD
jgi:diguanylate cyclase (GGDEF)-like protein